MFYEYTIGKKKFIHDSFSVFFKDYLSTTGIALTSICLSTKSLSGNSHGQ